MMQVLRLVISIRKDLLSFVQLYVLKLKELLKELDLLKVEM
jgi:hypothetical protein